MRLLWPEQVAEALEVSLATVREMAEQLEGAVWSPLDDGEFWVRADAIEHWRKHLWRPPRRETIVRTYPGGPETTAWPHA